MNVDANLSVDAALATAHARYAANNPNSRTANRRAETVLPGGNTRSVLHFEPYPLTLVRGVESVVWDVDGHQYIDFVGEFSAGLYGHSNEIIKAAIIEALNIGTVLAAPTQLEADLAAAITRRFPSMELLRFCNSGTEANIMAIVTALAVTGRRKILVFREAYHGGVLTFARDGSPINLPLDYVLVDYNDAEAAAAAIHHHADDLAAVIVEPILGAGGNIPATPEFLRMLRRESERTGALLIFDEVKTSRCGPGGMQGQLGIVPDLTTLGKYLGGGLPTGAFGGRREIMSKYDPRLPNAFRHAGTFNNNVCSMNAGLAGLTRVFTAERALEFAKSCEQFRLMLNDRLVRKKLPMQFTGFGSMFTVHFSWRPVCAPKDIPPISRCLAQLFHLECLLRGILVASRGDVFVSLAVNPIQMQSLEQAIMTFANSVSRATRARIAGQNLKASHKSWHYRRPSSYFAARLHFRGGRAHRSPGTFWIAASMVAGHINTGHGPQ